MFDGIITSLVDKYKEKNGLLFVSIVLAAIWIVELVERRKVVK